jgi:hypothetical protein
MPMPFIAVAAVAASAAGSFMQYRASKKVAGANQAIADQEAQQEMIRKRAAELDARRKQMEMVRQQQRARAQALAAGVNQGAGVSSSGVMGGYGQIAGESGNNLLGVTQNLGLARQMFDSNAAISGYRRNIAGYSSQAALGQGLSSLGGALLSSMGPLNSLSQGFGSPVPRGGYGPINPSSTTLGRGLY